MYRKRPIAQSGRTVARVAALLREDALSLARRRPVSTSLHRAVTQESGRLDDARHEDAQAAGLAGDRET